MWSVATITFAIAYGQFPLYEGNYNAYLLHGFASADRGQLADDWQAQTLDPFPVFSAIVAIPAALDWQWLFYAGHGLLLGVYLYAAVHIAEDVRPQSGLTGTVGIAATIALPLVWLGRDAISYVFKGDWGWYLQAGVAMQYVLGHMFQPSLFGVFCVASLAAFGRRWDWSALVLAATAVLLHFSYLITVLGMIVGYSVVRWRDMSSARSALNYLAIGLALCGAACLPVLRFLPTDEATAAEAARILADIRFPHHAIPARWLTQPGLFSIQTPMLIAGSVMAWRTRFRWAFILALVLGAVLLATQAATGSRRLALLFPWRVSAVLVPVAFSLVVGAFSRWAWARLSSRYVVAPAAVLSVLAASYGYMHTRNEIESYSGDPILPMLRAASVIATPDALFAIPTTMDRFRLETGARTLVDFKAHPYRDDEVVEWYARLSLANELDSDDSVQGCSAAETLHERYGVTHFVRPSDRGLVCDRVATMYQDDSFIIQQWL